jgi:hypothetical protein
MVTLKNIGMSEAEYYGIKNNKWVTTVGEFFTQVFILSVLLQAFIYFILFFFNLYILLKYKREDVKIMIRIFSLAILLFSIWLVITLNVSSNGRNDLFWGPADTGLFFMSISSLIINYLIYAYNLTNTITSPAKVYHIWKRFAKEYIDVMK